jgi:1,4-dihydroxy-2-naphthoyl-CoA hydrolase
VNLAATDAIVGGSDLSYGLECVELGDQRAQGNVLVRPELKQPSGAVHGGVYAAVAERLTSLATAHAVAAAGAEGTTVAAMSNQTSFLRPITEGVVHAVATAKHRGRTTWVWEVEFSDDQGRLCVLTRMTIAVRAEAEG